MKKILIILFALIGLSSISSAASITTFLCYANIGRTHVNMPVFGKLYSYQYCLEKSQFSGISMNFYGVYLPKPDSWNNCEGQNCKYGGIKWHKCEDKMLGITGSRGRNIGNGRIQYQTNIIGFNTPCRYSGGSGPVPKPQPIPPPIDPPLPPVDSIIFREGSIDNKLYTKVTGMLYYIRLMSKNNPTSSTALNGVTCTIKSRSDNKIYDVSVINIDSSNKAAQLKPPRSGYYDFLCIKKDAKGGEVKTIPAEFYAAPASYEVNTSIKTSHSNATIYGKLTTGSSNKQTLSSSSNTNIKIGDNINMTLDIKTKTAENYMDKGINTKLDVNELLFTHKNGNTCPSKTILTSSKTDLKFNEGLLKLSNQNVHSIKFSDVGLGSLKISYLDKETNNIIKSEESKGNCGGSTGFSCPYAPTIELSYPMSIFPANYKVELLDGANPIKVLYYGQGSDPKLDGLKTIKVTALDDKDAALKNNIQGCAAQDINVDMKFKSNDVLVKLLNKNGGEDKTLLTSNFKTNSSADKEVVLSVIKSNGDKFLPSEVKNPIYTTFDASLEYKGKEKDASYPKYSSPKFDEKELALLRARINLIDADNASDFSKMPITKIIYEFYCQSCDLKKLESITKVSNYDNSPTAHNWYIDKTFSNFNKIKVSSSNIITSDVIKVSSVSNISNGIQTINYNKAPKGQYQVKVKQDNRANDSFPSYLLYNRYHDDTQTSQSNVSWGTSAKVIVYDKLANDNRNYGLDTGDAKNTRGSSRIGGL